MQLSEEATPKLIIRETLDSAVAVGRRAADAAMRVEAKAEKKVREKTTSRFRSDPFIAGIYALLLVVSIIELYSASATEVSESNVYSPLIRHGIFLLLGLVFVVLHQHAHYRVFKDLAWPMGLLSIGMLICASMFGININGAQRAIMVGGYTVQPAEIVKLATVVLLATVLSKNQTTGGVTNRGIVYVATIVIIMGGAMLRNGLTNAVLLFGVSAAMFIVGGIQMKKLIMVFVIYAAAGGVFYVVSHSMEGEGVDRTETRENRVTRFLAGVDPDDPITDTNRQVMFAKFAQANGGLTGNGPGTSRESSRLPLAFSDYIYSIIVEDTGFVGGMLLLTFYIFLLFRAGVVARRCSRAFPAFLIMGCALLITLQALIHMCIVVGLCPVSGQPLPFISKGGTSVIVMSAALGMMLSVSRYAVTSGNKKEISAELRELPEDMHAANPTFVDPTKP